ncbi:MAG: zinc-dependent metalloprotease [Candidatus Eisenbacteria bacterium]|nr:zinc-dependent metalloprotease [Candidatus Eisenbacteria bacterium]
MPLRTSLIRALSTVALLAAIAAPSTADDKKPAPKAGEAPAAAAATPEKPYGDWKKLTQGAEVMKGFFNLYKKRENLYAEIRPDQMGKPVLGIFSFARGIGQNFLLGGLPLNDRLIEFQRAGDHVLVFQRNERFTAPESSAIEKAKYLSEANSVLASLKIESEQDSTKSVLVDLAPFLVSDLTDLAATMQFALGGKSAHFDRERSALGSVRVFPENVEIEALLTYTPNDRTNLDLNTVPDERFIPITVHYSFSKLPDQPMKPRMADDRTGFFLSAYKDFSRDTSENFWVRYVHRWRLEKKDPAAAVSEVVKPIVFYIDRTVPAEYRPFVRQGVENWQKAFEAAGLKGAIVAKDAPADSDWDPADVRYSTIRWITSSDPAFGAIGPSRVDPRTGEILDADILFEASFLQSFRNGYRRIVAPEAIADGVSPALRAWPSFLDPEARCDAGEGLADGGSLLHAGLLVDGLLSPGEPVPIDYVGKALVWAVMHEVGHSLGLRHNFRSSTSTPFDRLGDVAWTREHGLYSSVMDYATPNIQSDRSKQGEYYTSTVGDCDVWNIRYGYTPTGAATPAADYAVVKTIAEESNQAGHEYSADEDTYPADALDPRTNIFDLGDDPLAFAKQRTAYISGLWKNPKFEERVVGPHGEYPVLRRSMDTLLGQYASALGLSVKYVGGQYFSRNHRGQPDVRDPLIPVPAAKQREALDFLSQRAFAADAFSLPPSMLNRMAADRWTHWGLANSFSAPLRIDYSFNDRAFAIQSALLVGLLAPNLLARVREAESHSVEPLRLTEVFDRLTRSIWGEVGAGSAAAMKALDGPGTRRELQRAYVDRLAAMVVTPTPGAPDDARALARLQLTRIDQRITQAGAGKVALGDETRAHFLETRARIKRALEAQRQADVAGPAR